MVIKLSCKKDFYNSDYNLLLRLLQVDVMILKEETHCIVDSSIVKVLNEQYEIHINNNPKVFIISTAIIIIHKFVIVIDSTI